MNVTAITIEVPVYSPNEGFKYNWTKGFDIRTNIEGGQIKIVMNKEGLASLANHLLNLAQDGVPSGCHLHLDEHNSLEEGSIDLIIEKA